MVRLGGDIYLVIQIMELQVAGRAECTAPGGMREDFVVDGVIRQQDGSYAPSTIKVSQQDYWQALRELVVLVLEKRIFMMQQIFVCVILL